MIDGLEVRDFVYLSSLHAVEYIIENISKNRQTTFDQPHYFLHSSLFPRLQFLYIFGALPDNSYTSMKALQTCFLHFLHSGQKSSSHLKGVNLNKDYYKILQIKQDACDNTIKKSYLSLVKKFHPDLNPRGHDEFTEVQEAYNVLSDRKMRGYYDHNNKFYPAWQGQEEQHMRQDARNEKFYNRMRDDYRHTDREEREQDADKCKDAQESEEQAKQRKKFEDQIKLTRKILFTKNPIWQRANAFMNYEERQRRIEEKQKQLENLFPKGAKIAESLKKWMF